MTNPPDFPPTDQLTRLIDAQCAVVARRRDRETRMAAVVARLLLMLFKQLRALAAEFAASAAREADGDARDQGSDARPDDGQAPPPVGPAPDSDIGASEDGSRDPLSDGAGLLAVARSGHRAGSLALRCDRVGGRTRRRPRVARAPTAWARRLPNAACVDVTAPVALRDVGLLARRRRRFRDDRTAWPSQVCFVALS